MTCLSSHGALLRSPGAASMRAAAPPASSGATAHHRSLPARGPVRVCAALPQSVLSLKDVKVSDAMKSPPTTVSPDTSVFDVLELLVSQKISGAPVVDAAGKVLGMISGYDLLVLDATPGHLDNSVGIFPPVGRCDQFGGSLSRMWDSFKDEQERRNRSTGQTAGAVCHDAAVIHHTAALEDAADMIVRRKVHRLAVVDDTNTCIGILSRGDILQATYRVMMQSKA